MALIPLVTPGPAVSAADARPAGRLREPLGRPGGRRPRGGCRRPRSPRPCSRRRSRTGGRRRGVNRWLTPRAFSVWATSRPPWTAPPAAAAAAACSGVAGCLAGGRHVHSLSSRRSSMSRTRRPKGYGEAAGFPKPTHGDDRRCGGGARSDRRSGGRGQAPHVLRQAGDDRRDQPRRPHHRDREQRRDRRPGRQRRDRRQRRLRHDLRRLGERQAVRPRTSRTS